VKIVQRLKGYSASDIKSVVKEACMEPVRSEINKNMIMTVTKQEIRDVSIRDFERALNTIKPALTAKQVETYNQFKHLK
jgi:spastin